MEYCPGKPLKAPDRRPGQVQAGRPSEPVVAGEGLQEELLTVAVPAPHGKSWSSGWKGFFGGWTCRKTVDFIPTPEQFLAHLCPVGSEALVDEDDS